MKSLPAILEILCKTHSPSALSRRHQQSKTLYLLRLGNALIVARTLLEGGVNHQWLNSLAETTFFGVWSLPNFRDNGTQLPIITWPTTGWAYPVLIGGLYPDQLPEWEMGLHGYTLELAFPVTIGSQVLTRIRALFDESAAQGYPMTSTYRSGINIKFGKAFPDLLSQAGVLLSGRVILTNHILLTHLGHLDG